MGTGSQADQFITTTKSLASYSWRNCIDTQDIRIYIELQNDVVIPVSSMSTNIDEDVDKILLGKEIDDYAKLTQ